MKKENVDSIVTVSTPNWQLIRDLTTDIVTIKTALTDEEMAVTGQEYCEGKQYPFAIIEDLHEAIEGVLYPVN